MLYLVIVLIVIAVVASSWLCSRSFYLSEMVSEYVKLPFTGLIRFLVGLSNSKQCSHIPYHVIKVVLGPIVRRLWVGEVEGLENIPKDGACLVAFNHESYFDFICFTAVVERKIHYLAAEKFFEHSFWKWVMKSMGCIRVDRYSRVHRSAIRQIDNFISKERLIGIFPEGSRSPDGKLMRGKPGVAYLAIHTGVPVIPVGLVGTFEIMSCHDRFPRFKKAKIRIGKPIIFNSPEVIKSEACQMQQVTDMIMLRIASLTGEFYPCLEAGND